MEISRVESLPLVLEKDTIYLVKNGGFLEIYATGNTEEIVLRMRKTPLPLKVFSEKRNIAPESTVTYDVRQELETILSAVGVHEEELSTLYDLDTLSLEVRVLDTDPSSPTHNLYVNSEAMLVTGASDDGVVKVVNYSTTTQNVKIRIMVSPSGLPE